MNRVEHNSEMIHNLEYKIDDLKDLIEKLIKDYPPPLMTHKYRGSQQSSREVLPKFIDSTQGEPKNICKP
jgi:hypothetical protein